VLPAVVEVGAVTDDGASTGSGFAIQPLEGDEDRSIFITNAHVTEGAHAVGIRYGEDDFYRVQVLVEAPEYDLAILTMPIRPPATLPVRRHAEVQVGEAVIAVGSPLGLTETVTTGIISALNREMARTTIRNVQQRSTVALPGSAAGAWPIPSSRCTASV
jgi:putative serine protease PepD